MVKEIYAGPNECTSTDWPLSCTKTDPPIKLCLFFYHLYNASEQD